MRLAGILLAAFVLLSCSAQPSAQAPVRRGDTGSAPAASGNAGTQRRLVVGILNEPKGWGPWETATTIGGYYEIRTLAARSLSTVDGEGKIRPELAESVPSLDRGDWVINPDGTMDQTWRIKPSAVWHDGQPLTADDFVFGWDVLTDQTLPAVPPPSGFN